jgi:hypothetical protein
MSTYIEEMVTTTCGMLCKSTQKTCGRRVQPGEKCYQHCDAVTFRKEVDALLGDGSLTHFRKTIFEQKEYGIFILGDCDAFLAWVRNAVDLLEDPLSTKLIAVAALFAASHGHVRTLEWLMKHSPSTVCEAVDESGRNILLLAAKGSRLLTMKWILDHGEIDVHATDKDGKTAIAILPNNHGMDMLKLLVNKGGNIGNLKTNIDVMYLLMDTFDCVDPLETLKTLKWMKRKSGGESIESILNDHRGVSVRGYIKHNQVDIVKWMVEEGGTVMDPDPPYPRAESTVMYALSDEFARWDFAVARWLISSGHADVQEEFRVCMSSMLRPRVSSSKLPLSMSSVLRLIDIGDPNISVRDGINLWGEFETLGDGDQDSFLMTMLPRSDPPREIRDSLLDSDHSDLVLSGIELRRRLPEFLKERAGGLSDALSFLPNVLRAQTMKLDGTFSTEDMWATGLGTMDPQRKKELRSELVYRHFHFRYTNYDHEDT